jgi:hypothetical protein
MILVLVIESKFGGRYYSKQLRTMSYKLFCAAQEVLWVSYAGVMQVKYDAFNES